MHFKLSYDNGVNSFNYELSGDNTPEQNIVDVLKMAVETLFPGALITIPYSGEVDFNETFEMDEAEQMRHRLYDEVDTIIDEMYGYWEDNNG